jgi:hypothetical protein
VKWPIVGRNVPLAIASTAAANYQEQRLRGKAAPKSIKEEVGFLLRVLADRGELIRACL